MQSPILQGTLVASPVVGVPSAEGRTAEPQTSDTKKSTPERAGILFAELVPDDTSLVLLDAVVPVWPLAISPVPFGIAPTETTAVKDSDIAAVQPILLDAASGSSLSDNALFPLVTAPPVDPVGHAAKTGLIEDFDNGNAKPVSTDGGALGGPTAPMPSAAPWMEGPILPDGKSPPQLGPPEGLLVPDRASWVGNAPTDGHDIRIGSLSSSGQAIEIPVASAIAALAQKEVGDPTADTPDSPDLAPADRAGEPQQTTQVLPEFKVTPRASVANILTAVWALPVEMIENGPAMPQVRRDTEPGTTGSLVGPQDAQTLATKDTRAAATKWTSLLSLVPGVRYESEGQSGRIEPLTKSDSDSVISTAGAKADGSVPTLGASSTANLHWQAQLQKSLNTDKTTFDQGLIATSTVSVPASTGSAVLSRPEIAQGTASNLPHLVDGIAAALSRGHNGSATLTLAPEELGHVRLSFQPDMQTPDRLVVMLSFDRPETMDLFRRHADQLAEALRTAGYAGVQIGFGGTGTDGAGQQAGQTWATDFVADDQTPLAEDPWLSGPRRLASHAALDLRL